MAKKKFDVLVNITVATTIEGVEAENEEQAETIARNWIGDDYMHYVKRAEMLADYEVVETHEQDEDEPYGWDEYEVERLAEAYNALTCAQQDEFLRLTGNE